MPPDHIHADPAARHVGHLGGRAEARLKDEIVCVGVGEGVGGRDEPVLPRLSADAVAIPTTPVVRDLDHYLTCLVMRPQEQSCGGWLSGAFPYLRGLDPVV